MVYGLVSSFQSPRLTSEISSEMFEKEASNSEYEPIRRPEPKPFFLASSNLEDEIPFKGGSLSHPEIF
jgi:hypothetical protein